MLVTGLQTMAALAERREAGRPVGHSSHPPLMAMKS